METLPGKTVERLSQYRRSLLNCLENGKDYIFSHDLANLHHITAVQVRRDLMLLGYSSVYRKGYPVRKLIEVIGKTLDSMDGQNVAIVGMGNLGTALCQYLGKIRPKLNVVATFDINPAKVGKSINGVPCYHVTDLQKVVKEQNISIGVMTVPQDSAIEVADELEKIGIKGILNFTHISLNVPEGIYLEEYDMITSLEKVAYFVKKLEE
ncbi:MAG: redox-sensing transcriptional repressor Rex [Bacteroidota bacterium]|nr:redox-sensing transcriptional repressor Rex [Bacteroidota bacterium]